MKFRLRSVNDRKRAFKVLWEHIIEDLGRGRIPTYHILRVSNGEVTNHYMTPISLEPVDKEGSKMVWVEDFMFFLKLLLSLKGVVEVEYDPERPAVIFTYVVPTAKKGIASYLQETARKHGLCTVCYKGFYEALRKGDWRAAINELFKRIPKCLESE